MNRHHGQDKQHYMMKVCSSMLVLALASVFGAHAHDAEGDGHSHGLLASAAGGQAVADAPGAKTAGRGRFVFRHVAEKSVLPDGTKEKLHLAHGGFAVDPVTGEVFFGLKGVGIIWMSNDLGEKRVLPVKDPSILEGNFHNTTLLRRGDGQRFLALPDNEKGRVLIVTDQGELKASLGAPVRVNDYYGRGGAFNPTDTEYAANRLYVTDGYSPGNYILVADPWQATWGELVFGGKATAREYGLFGTAHGITLNRATRRLEIADRANSRIQSFDLEGTFLGQTKLPEGSLPCDVDFHQGYAVVGCLQGPGGQTPAPFYVLDQDGQVASEINPKNDFGLARYTHIHNAVWKPVQGNSGQVERLYVLATAWNPGDFAVFEVVK